MNRTELVKQIQTKKTYLCVGLDTDISKLPAHIKNEPDAVLRFNKAIIDATKDHCVAYKINTAFYEANGLKGWEALEKTADYIPSTHFKIADAKRGDIGNTSAQYAKAFFETLSFDAITVAPYMGADSIMPFLEYENKWTIVLGLTSNPGAKDFELQKVITETHHLDEGVHTIKKETLYLYERVLKTVSQWGNPDNLMFVIGATQVSEFEAIRQLLPDHFYLVPGVGAQGGSLKEISEKAMNKDCGLLVNNSRGIIYASVSEDFAEKAAQIAQEIHKEMELYF